MNNLNNQSAKRNMIRRSLAASLIALAFTSPVHSYEFSKNTNIEQWAGAYVGFDANVIAGGGRINRGAGNKKFDQYLATILPGAHLGYNFAPIGSSHNGGWLFGTELNLSFANLNERKQDAVLGDVKLDSSFLASTRLRAGYAFENFYVYGLAGLALSDFTVKPASQKDDEINLGLTFGAGVEYKMTDDWSMRLEALAYDFGDVSYKFNGTTRKVERSMSTISIGFSRKF